MIKSMFKRAMLSIARMPSRTIILGVILFVMANLVVASISIKLSVNESVEFAKKTLGSNVYLSVDMDKLRANMVQNQEGNRQMMRIVRPSVPMDKVKEMGALSYVKDFTYSISTSANASGFNIVEYENENQNERPPITSGNSAMIARVGDVQIIGINSYAFISQVKDSTMKLIDGTYFDETTEDKVIISYELANANELKVGDKISLENVETKNIYELEISGIYEINVENTQENVIYMNVDAASKYLREEEYNDGDYGVSNVSFELVNPSDVAEFVSSAKKIYDVEANNMILDIDTSAYDKMAGPIESVGSFANTILWIVVIATIAIVTLMINSNVKDRKYEIGVLMSLGASKKNAAGAILVELIIIGTISFILSFTTSYFLADSMSRNMLNNQLSMSEEVLENNFGRPNMIGGNRIDGFQSQSNNKNVDVIDEIDVSIGFKNYAMLFLVGYTIMGMACIVPTLNIIKYEPKTILTGRG